MSGQTIGTFVGGAIGFMVGGPMGAQVGAMLGGAVGASTDTIQGPKLGDIPVQTSQEGAFCPIVFGRPGPFPGNIIQQGEKIKGTKKERQGKGGPKVESDTVHQTFAIRICEGPAVCLRIWVDGKLAFSRHAGDQLDADTAAFMSRITLYEGTEDQLPDPSLEALPAEYGGGAGNVPAYTRVAYMVANKFDLTPWAGRIPQFEFEMGSCGTVVPGGVTDTGFDVFAWPTPTSGVKRTPDAITWSDVAGPGTAHENSLFFVGGGKLFVLKSGEGWVSEDRGGTWSAVSGIRAAIPNGMVYTSGLYTVFYGGGAFASTSASGTSFTDIPVPSRAYYIPAAIGQTVIAGSTNGYMIRSTDGGASFSAAFLVHPGSTISFDYIVATADRFAGFLRMQDPIYVSATGESGTWSNKTHPLQAYTGSFGGVAHGGGAIVAIGSLGRSMRSTDNGETWTEGATIPGFSAGGGNTNNLAYDKSTGLFVAVGLSQQIFTTADLGASWTLRSTGSSTTYEWVGYLDPTGYSGTELPDAPGYYVGESGEVVGPAGERVTDCITYLGEIEQAIARRVGVQPSQFDVSHIATIPVEGYLVGQLHTAADCLKPLQLAYFHDLPEYDLQLHAVVRGGTAALTLTDDDFVDDADGDTNTRRQAIEVPRKLILFFSDPSQRHVKVPVESEREARSVPSQGTQTLQLPLVMDRDEAQQRVNIMHAVTWEQAQDKMERTLPFYRFAELTCADCVMHDGKRWLIAKTEIMDGRMRIEALRDRVSNYTNAASAPPVITPQPPKSNLVGPTKFTALNLPRLRSSESTPGMYIAAAGVLEGWGGADIYLSVDGGASFEIVDEITASATMGKLTATAGTTGTMAVRLYAGALESATRAQLDARANAAAVGEELIQYADADETTADNYTLSGITRGLRGTDAVAHPSGTKFVAAGSLIHLPIDLAHSGRDLIFRAVSKGTAPENNPTLTVTYLPQFFGPQVAEPYTDDLGEPYTDVHGVPYLEVA